MGRTAPIEMFCTTPEKEQAVQPAEELPTQEEIEESSIAQMKNFLSEDPTLSNMESQDGIIKISRDSDNPYCCLLYTSIAYPSNLSGYLQMFLRKTLLLLLIKFFGLR